jgi:hypothetical protein
MVVNRRPHGAGEITGWHKVVIVQGARYSKQELLASIEAGYRCDTDNFRPIAFQKAVSFRREN